MAGACRWGAGHGIIRAFRAAGATERLGNAYSRGWALVTRSLLFAVQSGTFGWNPRPGSGLGRRVFDILQRDTNMWVYDKTSGELLAEIPVGSNASGAPRLSRKRQAVHRLPGRRRRQRAGRAGRGGAAVIARLVGLLTGRIRGIARRPRPIRYCLLVSGACRRRRTWRDWCVKRRRGAKDGRTTVFFLSCFGFLASFVGAAILHGHPEYPGELHSGAGHQRCG